MLKLKRAFVDFQLDNTCCACFVAQSAKRTTSFKQPRLTTRSLKSSLNKQVVTRCGEQCRSQDRSKPDELQVRSAQIRLPCVAFTEMKYVRVCNHWEKIPLRSSSPRQQKEVLAVPFSSTTQSPCPRSPQGLQTLANRTRLSGTRHTCLQPET
jgi:hypothetical protein